MNLAFPMNSRQVHLMPTPMHLLDATMFWNATGGVRRYVLAKNRWARSHTDWDHTIATPMGNPLATLRVPSLPLPGSAGMYRLPWQRMPTARLLRQADPDIIECADPYRLAWASLDAAQALGIPAVAFCHSNLDQMARLTAGKRWGALAARAARRYTVHVYRRFQLVLAPSRSMAAQLREWGVPRVSHQPLGVDTSVFMPRGIDHAWRASLGLARDDRLLMYVGRFAPEKNLGTLVETVHKLGPRHWLVAVGSGPVPPQGDRVITLPTEHDTARLAAMLSSADVFVHAGAQETFGLSVLEAMACGLPAVVRQAGGLTELVNLDVGRTVAGGSVSAFADAIDNVLRGDRQALGQAARARALRYDWERVLPELWRHYRRVIGNAADARQRA
ncbi:MAG: glycosyltransferase [Burkholderiaceae bacterium]